MRSLFPIAALMAVLGAVDAEQLRGSNEHEARKLPGMVSCDTYQVTCPGSFECMAHQIGRLPDYPHHYTCACSCEGSRNACSEQCAAEIESFKCDQGKCCEKISNTEFVFNQLGNGLIFDCLSPEAA